MSAGFTKSRPTATNAPKCAPLPVARVRNTLKRGIISHGFREKHEEKKKSVSAKIIFKKNDDWHCPVAGKKNTGGGGALLYNC